MTIEPTLSRLADAGDAMHGAAATHDQENQ
jgi:hypothetical protein